MKKYLMLAIAVGLATPFFTHLRVFYYLAVLFTVALLIFSLKKQPLRLLDFLIVLVITIPLHTFRIGSEENFIRLSEIAFIPLFVIWFIIRFWDSSRRPLMARKELLLLVFYLAINIIATRNSLYPLISIKRVIILAYLFLFTYMVTDIVDAKDKLDGCVRAMILISGATSIIALLQSVFPQLLIFNQVAIGKFLGITFYRVGVGWHDPNYYALYQGMNAALTLCYILPPRKVPFLLKACFFLQVIGLIVTFSRTVFVSLLLVVMYILYRFKEKRLLAVLVVLVLFVLGVVGTSMVSIYKNNPFLASVIYRVADKEKAVRQPFLIMGHRFAAFKANWQMFLDHPVIGVGPFMAMYNFEKYKPQGYESPTSLLASHNQYLQLLAEKGILGFVLFIGFILIVLKGINRRLKVIRRDEYRRYLMGFKSSIFVYLFSGFALETSHEMQFWLSIGLCLAVFGIINKENG